MWEKNTERIKIGDADSEEKTSTTLKLANRLFNKFVISTFLFINFQKQTLFVGRLEGRVSTLYRFSFDLIVTYQDLICYASVAFCHQETFVQLIYAFEISIEIG